MVRGCFRFWGAWWSAWVCLRLMGWRSPVSARAPGRCGAPRPWGSTTDGVALIPRPGRPRRLAWTAARVAAEPTGGAAQVRARSPLHLPRHDRLYRLRLSWRAAERLRWAFRFGAVRRSAPCGSTAPHREATPTRTRRYLAHAAEPGKVNELVLRWSTAERDATVRAGGPGVASRAQGKRFLRVRRAPRPPR